MFISTEDIREQVIAKVAKDLDQPEELVKKIFGFQWKEGSKATKLYNTLEFSGLFKLRVGQDRVKNAIKRKEKLYEAFKLFSVDVDHSKVMSGIQEQIEYLKTKLDGTNT